MKITNRFPGSNLNPPEIPESVQNIVNNREELASSIAPTPDIPSRENKGGRGSRVDKYEGPDTVLRPEIESKEDSYKGPKVIIREPLIKSRVKEYKGPDSINDSNVPPIPDAVTNIVNNRLDLASKILKTPDTKETSTESQSSKKKKVTVDDLIRHRIENQEK
jgi:hypothetical protein